MGSMTLMYDSTSPQNIPDNALAVAFYTNGLYAWSAAQLARFAKVPRKSITVFTSGPGSDADILDVELGDAGATASVAWVVAQRAAGRNPTVYCSRVGSPGYGWPDCQAAFNAAGVKQPMYWIADYTQSSHIVPGSVATQWEDFKDLYDLSEATNEWLGLVPPPDPTPPPTNTEDSMASAPISFKPGQTDVFQCNGIWYHKWIDAEGLHNEDVLANNDSGKPITGITFPPQTPQMAVIGNQLVGTAEDSNKMVWYIAQGLNDGSWGVLQLL